MQRDDLAHMSIDERLDEVASLLAVGFLRVKRRAGCPPPDAFSSNPLPHGRGSDSATCESAEGSKVPAELPCHLSETLAPCAPRCRRLEAGDWRWEAREDEPSGLRPIASSLTGSPTWRND